MAYHISETPLGLIVYGSPNGDELFTIIDRAMDLGFFNLDRDLAYVARATLVYVSEESRAAWLREIDSARGPAPAALEERALWYKRGIGGASGAACTLLARLLGDTDYLKDGIVFSPEGRTDVERCVELLRLFPELHSTFDELELDRSWTGLREAWASEGKE